MSLQSEQEFPTPVFPFYLDTEMLTGFIATLEDGFSLASDVSQQTGGSASSKNQLEGEAGVGGGLLQNLFKLNISGGIESATSQDDREEYRFILQHTEASLFNRCRATMAAAGISTTIAKDTTSPLIGDIVEITGVLHRNPLHDLLDLANLFGFDSSNQSGGPNPKGQQRSNKAPLKESGGQSSPDIFRILRDSLAKSNLIDFVLSTDALSVPNVILTLRRSIDIDAALDLSVGGVCSVLGKVTNTYPPDQAIHLYRRTVLQWMPDELIQPVFTELTNQPGFNFDTSRITITGGAIQILPLAIFI